MSTELPSQQALMIGRRVRSARERHGWTMTELAQRAGILTVDETLGLRGGETGDTKGRRRREIPLSPELLARLLAHRSAQTRLGPWMFANPATGRPWSPDALAAQADRVMAAAGLPKIGLKDMRASCATALLDQNVPLPRVSELLGHSSVAITAAYYQRTLRLAGGRTAQLSGELDAALDRAAGAEQPAALRPSGTADGTPE